MKRHPTSGRSLGLRCATALLLLPLTVLLCGGPLTSAAIAQQREGRDRTAQIAARLGLDPLAVRDPAAYAQQQAQAARARRAAAVAKLRSPEPSAAQRAEVEQVQQAQALHTLAGLGRDVRQGRRIDTSKHSTALQRLRDRTAQSRVRFGKPLPAVERPAQHFKAAPGGPRAQAPASWRNPLRALRAMGGRLRYVGKHLPRWQGGVRGAQRFFEDLVHLTLTAPDDDDLLPTVDAQSDDPLIVAKAEQLGGDPIRIYNFVQDTIATELYAGSKKGALGTLREGAGNHVDQASLLIALYRAAGIPARYEIGNIAMTAAQANEWAGALELSVSASLIGSAGIANTFLPLGPGQGMGLSVEHVWVRAFVPTSAYRGVARPGAVSTWVHLAPSIKQVSTQNPVDLRDAVQFDFDGYLAQRRTESPVELYEAQLRTHIRLNDIACETLDSAQPKRSIVPDALPLLPADLPVRRVLELAAMPELPADLRHLVRITGRTSQNAQQFSYEAPMASLWGTSVSLVYEPASAADAQVIADHGGLENTPAYLVKMRALLKLDAQAVAQGAAETPGLDQRLVVDTVSPATGLSRIEHPLIVSGVYGFALDPGKVPADLISERVRRYDTLSGDDLEAEKLYVTALSYFHDYARAREQAAGLHWHRLYKEVEEAAAMVSPRVEEFNGVPLSVARDFFTFDAPGLRFGDYSIDGDNRRSASLLKLVGYESSVLEHEMGERFRGAKAFSAVRLLQVASEDSVEIKTFSQGSLEEALEEIQWPVEREQRLRDFANRGFVIQAPVTGYTDPDLGPLFGFIATQPDTGAGAYIVGTLRGELRGAECTNDNEPPSENHGCRECNATGSPVHLLSGTLPLLFADLSLPARGMPLVFDRAYHARMGWTHGFEEGLIAEGDGSLTWLDERGMTWRFTPDTQSGVWAPPPKLYQRIEATQDGYEMRFKDGLLHRFDLAGKLLAREDLNGHATVLEYGPSGRLARVTGDGGNFFDFGYDALGHLASVTDSAGRSVTFVNDAAGNILTETDVLGEVRSYGYDELGRMRTRTDFRGNVSKMDYDDVGRVVRLEDPLGGVDTYAYDFRNRRTVHTDRRGHALHFELNELGKIVRRLDPLGNETVMGYDARGNKTSETDSRGNTTSMIYDGDGNLLSRTDPLGAETTFTYGAFSRLLTTTDALERTTENTYDAAGNLLTTTDALQHVTSYTYTPDGLTETITRPGNAITSMTYDAVGNLESITDPEDGTTTLTYDAAGHVVTVTNPDNQSIRTMVVGESGRTLEMEDAAGALTSFTYDPEGNRTSTTDPDGQITTFQYDALSRLVATTDAHGKTSHQEYDAESNVTARTDARGFRTEMRYDAIGRLIESCDALGECSSMAFCAGVSTQPSQIVDALGNVTRVECDELGRDASRTDPLGNTTLTSYDLLGRRDKVTDPAGHETSLGYDELGRLTSVTDPRNGVTSYDYDERGNRTSVTDASGHTTFFEYDLADRLVRETTPTGTVTEYGYDTSGHRTLKLDGKGQTTEYDYDETGRLVETTYDDGTTAKLAYDQQGRRIFEQSQDSTREMTYDALGRLATVVDIDTGRTIEYGYDALGNRTSMAVLPDGDVTTYAWDGRGLLTRMTDPEGGEYRFSYDDAGRRTVTSYPNGMTLHTIYDTASRVLGMVYVNAARQLIELFGYRYDSRGNRLAKVFGDGGAEVYGYDELSRLTSVTYPSGRAVQYVYDAVGNRLSMTEGTSGGGPAPCPGDADCDGIADNLDNCPAIANPSQQDSDSGQLSSPGPTALYRFEESSGTTALDSAGSHNGTLQGGATRVTAGAFGQALSLDGVDDAVQTPVNLDQTSSSAGVTLQARVYPTSTSGGRHHFLSSDDGGFDWSIIRDGGTWQVFSGQNVHSVAPVDLNQWQHVAVVFKPSSGVRFYKNGTEVGVPAIGFNATGANLAIGKNAGFIAPQFFAGQIDEVAVYNRPLTATEVALHAERGLFGDGMGDACDPCPSSADVNCAPLTCQDQDGDGYGLHGASACAGGAGSFDCDDGNAGVHPGVVEVCDGEDNDCDGQADEQCMLGAQATIYTYNALNQMLSSTGPQGPVSFVYDANGNQVQKAASGLTTMSVYDARDRLVQVAVNSQPVLHAGYDTRDLRSFVADSMGTRRILLDGVEELAEYDASSGERISRYDHDPTRLDALLAQTTSMGKVNAVTDMLGSVYALSDISGGTASRYAYDVYGSRTISMGSMATKWGYTGRAHEAGIGGAIYYRAREYDALTGTFTASDPYISREIDTVGSHKGTLVSDFVHWFGLVPANDGSRYIYANANPVIGRDPFGLMVFSTAATAAYAIRIPFVANFYLQGSLNGNLGFNPISLSSSYSLALGSGVGGPVAYSITAGYAFYWGYDDACSVQGYSVIDFIDAVVGGLNFTFAMINAPKRSAYPPVHYTTGGMIGVGFDLGMDGIPLPGVGEVVSQTFMITFVGCCPDPEWIATD